MMSPNTDLVGSVEEGLVTSMRKPVVPSSIRPDSTVRSSSPYVTHNHTTLQTFQVLVGILPATPTCSHRPTISYRQIFWPPSTLTNIGLYQRTIFEEWKNRIAYLLTSYIINSLYLLQILLAATFTALSAYRSSGDVSLTVLGVINTVVAGILAWLKGQGVPNRFRKARDAYAAIVMQIEMVEREFSEQGRLDPWKERDRLAKLFEDARVDQQANYPDLYVNSTGIAARRGEIDMAKQLDDVKAEAAKVQKELAARIETLVRRSEGKAAAKMENALE